MLNNEIQRQLIHLVCAMHFSIIRSSANGSIVSIGEYILWTTYSIRWIAGEQANFLAETFTVPIILTAVFNEMEGIYPRSE